MLEEMTEEQRQALQEKLKNMNPEELAQLQKQQCIFCQIISGKIPAKKIYDDEIAIAILDINPASKGHLLLLPKEHYMIMPQVPDGVLAHLFLLSKKLSQTLLRTFKVGGTSIFIANGQVAGQRAQHFMIHVIPRKEGDNLLPLPEKIITAQMQEKVKRAVQGKLYQLLGFESPPSDVQEPGTQDTVPQFPSTSESMERVKKVAKKKTVPTDETTQASEKSSTKASTKIPSRKDDEDVSLDDIANLFK